MLFTPFFLKLFDSAIKSFMNVSIYDKIVPNIWSLHSISNNGGVVSPLILLAGLIVLTFVLYVIYKSLNIKQRIFHTWACGYNTSSHTQYSATGFAGPIRRFFTWLYDPDIHFEKEVITGHKTKFIDARFSVHIRPLFERSLYQSSVKLTNKISYYVYRLAHFEQSRYAAMIFNMLLSVLFSYRIFIHEFSWANLVLESVVMVISVKVLLVGGKE
ncbi:MAG: hydrogenase, partial [Campylobacteraceae bacterium]|nr:hydrogenase [Campylobacteraceae bacterium]